MTLAWIYLALLPVAAGASWRWSRFVAGALLLALAACGLYLATGWEALRLVSVATGSVGVWVLTDRATHRAANLRDVAMVRRVYEEHPLHGHEVFLRCIERGIPRWRFGRPDRLAALLVFSAGADGAAYVLDALGKPWGALPILGCGVLVTMVGVGLWPERRRP